MSYAAWLPKLFFALPRSFAAQGCTDCCPSTLARDRQTNGMPCTPSLTSCSHRVDPADGPERTLRAHRSVGITPCVPDVVPRCSAGAGPANTSPPSRRRSQSPRAHLAHTDFTGGRCAPKVNRASPSVDQRIALNPTEDDYLSHNRECGCRAVQGWRAVRSKSLEETQAHLR